MFGSSSPARQGITLASETKWRNHKLSSCTQRNLRLIPAIATTTSAVVPLAQDSFHRAASFLRRCASKFAALACIRGHRILHRLRLRSSHGISRTLNDGRRLPEPQQSTVTAAKIAVTAIFMELLHS